MGEILLVSRAETKLIENVDSGAIIYIGLANAIRWKAPEKAPRSPNISKENKLKFSASSQHFCGFKITLQSG